MTETRWSLGSYPKAGRRRILIVGVVLMSACLAMVCGCDDGSSDCDRGCEHVMACKETGYDDSDLENMTMKDCLKYCEENTTAEVKECVLNTTDCFELDEVCDAF